MPERGCKDFLLGKTDFAVDSVSFQIDFRADMSFDKLRTNGVYYLDYLNGTLPLW